MGPACRSPGASGFCDAPTVWTPGRFRFPVIKSVFLETVEPTLANCPKFRRHLRHLWEGIDPLNQMQEGSAHIAKMVQTSQVRIEASQRRRTSRQRCLFACRIVYGPEAFTLDGMIRDVSDSGARIRLPSPMPLPKSFRVILRDGVCHETETIWRRGQELGVRFLAPIDLQDPTDSSVRMLRRLWAEMAGRANDMTAPSI